MVSIVLNNFRRLKFCLFIDRTGAWFLLDNAYGYKMILHSANARRPMAVHLVNLDEVAVWVDPVEGRRRNQTELAGIGIDRVECIGPIGWSMRDLAQALKPLVCKKKTGTVLCEIIINNSRVTALLNSNKLFTFIISFFFLIINLFYFVCIFIILIECCLMLRHCIT